MNDNTLDLKIKDFLDILRDNYVLEPTMYNGTKYFGCLRIMREYIPHEVYKQYLKAYTDPVSHSPRKSRRKGLL